MKLKYTKFQLAFEIIALLLMVGLMVFIALNWAGLPDKIPGHYNAAGEIDRWGDKSEILAIPLVGGLLYLLLTVITFFPKLWNMPFKITEENRAAVYGSIKSMLLILKAVFVSAFFYITYCMMQANPLSVFMLPVISLVLVAAIGISILRTVKIAKSTGEK